MNPWPIRIGLGILSAVLGLALGLIVQRIATARQRAAAKAGATRILEEARRQADLARKSADIEAREHFLREKERFEGAAREARGELEAKERLLAEQDHRLQRDQEDLRRFQTQIEADRRSLADHRIRIESRETELNRVLQEQTARLERISGLTPADARRELMKNVEDELRTETTLLAQRMRESAVRDAEREARRLILIASQRLGAEQSIDSTVTVVALPNDEMKGRIIGREGRNIRSFELATGIDVIIDDTPEAVLLSGFDPVRREIARLSMERLVADGRIHPGRIEEVVQKVGEEVDREIQELGEKTAAELGVHGVAPEVLNLLGRLRYRTSSGQNVLKHSIEVARLASMIAAELGLDAETAKRAGLLHDIGKAINHEVEGPHAIIGMEFLERHGEAAAICEAVGAHHGELATENVFPVLVSTADAISGARPGARRESIETYLKRLSKLEDVADSFPGVERSFAIQAGREIRILVQPKNVGDGAAESLATQIARRVEKDLQYPGQIKVVVIRETRFTDYAR